MKWKKIALSFLACLFGMILAGHALASTPEEFTADDVEKPLPAPTIISPNKNTITSNRLEVISGLTVSDSFVKIYIDGVYNGKTAVLKHKSGTAHFSYRPFLSLSRGWHKYSVIAEFADGRQSRPYNSEFNVEYPMPAPTMLKTAPSPKLTAKPLAIGLAKNNSRITVYVNNKYDGSFLVKNHKSGTANFAYQVKANLKRGTNKIIATATDSRGKTSRNSNALYYKAAVPRISSAAFEDASSEKKESAAEKKDNNETSLKVEVKKQTANSNDLAKTPPAPIDQEVQKILEDSKMSGATTSPGSLDENNGSQNKLKTNIIIFILLLLAIIGWIIWVNREMVKERKDTSADDNSPPST
jgi:hypothetical protein